jgi:hypothetical protein
MIPYVEPKMKMDITDMPSGDDKQQKDDMLVNNLVYRQPVDLSLAKSRSHTKQFFQRSDYLNAGGKTAICDWNTGSSYINLGNSFLVFDVRVNATNGTAPTYTFGTHGSAMNCVNRLNIRTKSGSEIDRVDYVPLWSRVDNQYNNSSDYKLSVMGLAGYGQTHPVSVPTAISAPYKFAIPLERLAPIFCPLKSQLMPPQLASGLHIELVFEDVLNVVRASAALTGATIDILNIHFLLDQVDLSDEAQKAISVESAETGLEWVTPRVYSVQTSLGSGVATANVQIRKAVSQATRAYGVLQTGDQYGDSTKDTTASMIFPPSSKFQYNLGSLYFPNQECVDTNKETPISTFIEAQYAFDKTKDFKPSNDVSVTQFRSDSSIFAMTSSRDDSLYLSGLNINNSRALQFKVDVTWEVGDTGSHILTSFLEYVQVVKAYNDQSVVSI